MRRVKVIGLSLLFGLCSVVITTVGFIVAAIAAVLTPILMVFTGLWVIWFCTREFDKDDPGSPGSPD